MNYSIIVPTFNGGATWREAANAIASQQPEPQRVLIIDSGSSDGTFEVAESLGFDVRAIRKLDFDHGGTRQLGVNLLREAEIVVFLTQDAKLSENHSISKLICAFDRPEVGAAYGRQIAGESASKFEQHARSFNYPNTSAIKSKETIPAMGMKAAFCSNSFAAYRISALKEVGGFPSPTLFAEDMFVAARMILAGFSIAYQASAQCEHWHDYTVIKEFKRAFDIGVFHNRERWILKEFGNAQGEGGKLIKTGLQRIAIENFPELPRALVKYLAKMVGYAAGRAECVLPNTMKRKLSMNRAFWETNG